MTAEPPSTPLLDRICKLAQAPSLSLQYKYWDWLRVANPSGQAVLAASVITRGENIFWTESSKVPGLVFLRKPARVIEALEGLNK